MPDQSPYVHCPSCGCSFVAASKPSASDPQPENDRRAGALHLPVLVLRSWKEIACYVGSGVRTAQRWEHELALPVRRPCARARTSVMAFPEELETWLHRAPTAVHDRENLVTTPQQKHCA
jgi:hypothetical protein